jgi:hydrogenase 3 maturation protease
MKYALEDYLELLLEDGKRLVVLGAGSVLKADDAAGVMVAERLIDHLGGENFPRLKIINGSTAPENFTGVIKKFEPEHVLIIDAADFKGNPGDIAVIDPAVVGGVSFSTHMLPLKIMLEYLRQEVGCGVAIVGIQPADLTFGGEVTAEVKKAVDEFVDIFVHKII